MVKPNLKVSGEPYRRACSGRISVYIDSFNLYHGLRSADVHAQTVGGAGWRHCYWYDPTLLAAAVVPEGCDLGDVRFFTAHALGAQQLDDAATGQSRESRRKRQVAVLDALTARGTSIIAGVYSPRIKKCGHCGGRWTSFEEKMTDTRMAVQIVVDAMHDRFDTCVVISADADLVPPLETLKHEFPDKGRVVIAPPQRNAKKHLQQIAACFKLTRDVLEQSLMPNPVVTATGFKIHRPQEWDPQSYPAPTDAKA